VAACEEVSLFVSPGSRTWRSLVLQSYYGQQRRQLRLVKLVFGGKYSGRCG